MKNFDLISRLAKQNGQALIMSVFFMAISIAIVYLVFNIGQLNTEKTRLVNAADAAVYSGGIYFARNLNFLAYTNRAMIANHVSIGHFISYVSWLRYVNDSLDKLNRFSRFIPLLNTATLVSSGYIESVKNNTENIAALLLASSERMNTVMQTAQLKSQFTMNGVLSISNLLDVKIMDKVAKTYSPNIRVNYKDDVLEIEPSWIKQQLITDMAKTLQFVKQYRPDNDGKKLDELITNEYLELEPWIKGNRGWDINGGVIRIVKEGKTSHVMSEYKSDWKAYDDLFLERLRGFNKKKINMASGQASAQEFVPKYQGVASYYDRRKRESDSNSLKISALATLMKLPSRRLYFNEERKIRNNIQVLSRVEIYYQIPNAGFRPDSDEGFANLYNPFWQVRLTSNSNE